MARESGHVFLEEWLRKNSGVVDNVHPKESSPTSARAIIQAWADLRESLLLNSFGPHHLQCLKTLLSSQDSVHVADPQAKVIISILASRSLSLPHESYPLFLRVLYIWVRKSFRPSSGLIDSAVEVLSNLFSINFESTKNPLFVSEGVILLGAIAFVQSTSDNSKTACLDVICRLLEEEYLKNRSFEGLPDILAGVGYALSSRSNVHFSRILDWLLGVWGKEDGIPASVSHGLMILHLIEWVFSGFLNSGFTEKIKLFSTEILEASKLNYNPFALVMAAAGVLRASNTFFLRNSSLEIVSRLKASLEALIVSIAENFMTEPRGYTNSYDSTQSLLLQCISLALARSGPVSFHAPLFGCLASALLNEIFPLRSFYTRVFEGSSGLGSNEVRGHLESILFKEAGVVTGVLCKYYSLADETDKSAVENLVWNYCQDIYTKHRQIALWLRGRDNELLADLEKIGESIFLMVVVFALEVTKHKLSSKFSKETHTAVAVQILVSFSCVEYFRRMRLPEYMDTIRRVIVSVQEYVSACVSFVESMPSYVDLITNQQEYCSLQKKEYLWSKDEVQTARLLFYIRVISTCIVQLPAPVYRKMVASTMFLYMGHPTAKVARAAHSMFVAFISSAKASDNDGRVSLKEQLAFYYIQRSLELYPGITPFEGMASGVAALVQHLPAGSPASYYIVQHLVDKTDKLCSEVSSDGAGIWKNWQGDGESCKKILELLLRLIFLVDIQVLPNYMKLIAQLILNLPKEGQTLSLNELYSQVAESDDVTRKPTLVSWLQSLSYLCSQAASGKITDENVQIGSKSASLLSSNSACSNTINARL